MHGYVRRVEQSRHVKMTRVGGIPVGEEEQNMQPVLRPWAQPEKMDRSAALDLVASQQQQEPEEEEQQQLWPERGPLQQQGHKGREQAKSPVQGQREGQKERDQQEMKPELTPQYMKQSREPQDQEQQKEYALEIRSEAAAEFAGESQGRWSWSTSSSVGEEASAAAAAEQQQQDRQQRVQLGTAPYEHCTETRKKTIRHFLHQGETEQQVEKSDRQPQTLQEQQQQQHRQQSSPKRDRGEQRETDDQQQNQPHTRQRQQPNGGRPRQEQPQEHTLTAQGLLQSEHEVEHLQCKEGGESEQNVRQENRWKDERFTKGADFHVHYLSRSRSRGEDSPPEDRNKFSPVSENDSTLVHPSSGSEGGSRSFARMQEATAEEDQVAVRKPQRNPTGIEAIVVEEERPIQQGVRPVVWIHDRGDGSGEVKQELFSDEEEEASEAVLIRQRQQTHSEAAQVMQERREENEQQHYPRMAEWNRWEKRRHTFPISEEDTEEENERQQQQHEELKHTQEICKVRTLDVYRDEAGGDGRIDAARGSAAVLDNDTDASGGLHAVPQEKQRQQNPSKVTAENAKDHVAESNCGSSGPGYSPRTDSTTGAKVTTPLSNTGSSNSGSTDNTKNTLLRRAGQRGDYAALLTCLRSTEEQNSRGAGEESTSSNDSTRSTEDNPSSPCTSTGSSLSNSPSSLHCSLLRKSSGSNSSIGSQLMPSTKHMVHASSSSGSSSDTSSFVLSGGLGDSSIDSETYVKDVMNRPSSRDSEEGEEARSTRLGSIDLQRALEQLLVPLPPVDIRAALQQQNDRKRDASAFYGAPEDGELNARERLLQRKWPPPKKQPKEAGLTHQEERDLNWRKQQQWETEEENEGGQAGEKDWDSEPSLLNQLSGGGILRRNKVNDNPHPFMLLKADVEGAVAPKIGAASGIAAVAGDEMNFAAPGEFEKTGRSSSRSSRCERDACWPALLLRGGEDDEAYAKAQQLSYCATSVDCAGSSEANSIMQSKLASSESMTSSFLDSSTETPMKSGFVSQATAVTTSVRASFASSEQRGALSEALMTTRDNASTSAQMEAAENRSAVAIIGGLGARYADDASVVLPYKTQQRYKRGRSDAEGQNNSKEEREKEEERQRAIEQHWPAACGGKTVRKEEADLASSPVPSREEQPADVESLKHLLAEQLSQALPDGDKLHEHLLPATEKHNIEQHKTSDSEEEGSGDVVVAMATGTTGRSSHSSTRIDVGKIFESRFDGIHRAASFSTRRWQSEEPLQGCKDACDGERLTMGTGSKDACEDEGLTPEKGFAAERVEKQLQHWSSGFRGCHLSSYRSISKLSEGYARDTAALRAADASRSQAETVAALGKGKDVDGSQLATAPASPAAEFNSARKPFLWEEQREHTTLPPAAASFHALSGTGPQLRGEGDEASYPSMSFDRLYGRSTRFTSEAAAASPPPSAESAETPASGDKTLLTALLNAAAAAAEAARGIGNRTVFHASPGEEGAAQQQQLRNDRSATAAAASAVATLLQMLLAAVGSREAGDECLTQLLRQVMEQQRLHALQQQQDCGVSETSPAQPSSSSEYYGGGGAENCISSSAPLLQREAHPQQHYGVCGSSGALNSPRRHRPFAMMTATAAETEILKARKGVGAAVGQTDSTTAGYVETYYDKHETGSLLQDDRVRDSGGAASKQQISPRALQGKTNKMAEPIPLTENERDYSSGSSLTYISTSEESGSSNNRRVLRRRLSVDDALLQQQLQQQQQKLQQRPGPPVEEQEGEERPQQPLLGRAGAGSYFYNSDEVQQQQQRLRERVHHPQHLPSQQQQQYQKLEHQQVPQHHLLQERLKQAHLKRQHLLLRHILAEEENDSGLTASRHQPSSDREKEDTLMHRWIMRQHQQQWEKEGENDPRPVHSPSVPVRLSSHGSAAATPSDTSKWQQQKCGGSDCVGSTVGSATIEHRSGSIPRSCEYSSSREAGTAYRKEREQANKLRSPPYRAPYQEWMSSRGSSAEVLLPNSNNCSSNCSGHGEEQTFHAGGPLATPGRLSPFLCPRGVASSSTATTNAAANVKAAASDASPGGAAPSSPPLLREGRPDSRSFTMHLQERTQHAQEEEQLPDDEKTGAAKGEDEDRKRRYHTRLHILRRQEAEEPWKTEERVLASNRSSTDRPSAAGTRSCSSIPRRNGNSKTELEENTGYVRSSSTGSNREEHTLQSESTCLAGAQSPPAALHPDSRRSNSSSSRPSSVRPATGTVPPVDSTKEVVRGVYFDVTNQAWAANMRVKGRVQKKSFSLKRYGSEARQRAIQARREMENDFGKTPVLFFTGLPTLPFNAAMHLQANNKSSYGDDYNNPRLRQHVHSSSSPHQRLNNSRLGGQSVVLTGNSSHGSSANNPLRGSSHSSQKNYYCTNMKSAGSSHSARHASSGSMSGRVTPPQVPGVNSGSILSQQKHQPPNTSFSAPADPDEECKSSPTCSPRREGYHQSTAHRSYNRNPHAKKDIVGTVENTSGTP